jgi:glycine cleavage system H protein
VTSYPEHLQYTVEHEWLAAGTPATVGITETAAQALGELVYVELPEVGDEVRAGTVCGEVESTKSVSELYSPVSGTVVEVNEAAIDDPALVSSDPYGAGWLLRVEVTGTGPLLTADEYRAQVEV